MLGQLAKEAVRTHATDHEARAEICYLTIISINWREVNKTYRQPGKKVAEVFW